ncbi:hypothetical protein ACFFRR_009105 [Megaselia abdita]
MANPNPNDLIQGDHRRFKSGHMFANAMGDGYRNKDFRKPQANKKVQAEEDNYSTGDDLYDYRDGDRLVYKAPPQKYIPCDYRVHGDVPYVERCQQPCYKFPPARKEGPPKNQAQQAQPRPNKNQFELLRETFIKSNNIPDKIINRCKVPEVSPQLKNEFIKDCCDVAVDMNYVEKNSKGQHILKPQFRGLQQGHASDHSDLTYSKHHGDVYSTDQFSDEQESSEEKAKRPLMNYRPQNTAVTVKPSARSNGTSRSKKAEELVNLQKLKSDIIEVIQDGIQKIEKTTCEKPSGESQNLQNSSTSINNQNSDLLQSDVLTTFVKQLRDNHLGNILHEVKNLHFLESLPERCQNDVNKKREA